ncbi:hybrid sensor histidine kinase/response regulator [Roseofilum capinflatum]|uniref:histidine kinase n=1 Tax=Roseofilum capinflatum BLCC-M114 TaxID=3022440 RepID=A0ABT7B6R5_9CYAN|nr:response regulator [Roseofilum capinflatum]MDJ1174849.1 response regulator [Roseofilum capinflatum BLCC-M114]
MVKVLVIEDEELIRENILDLLEAEDFEGLGAENGQVGVEIAKAQIPDLILCDVMMPQLDGYGVLEQLRCDPKTAMIPFIFLTAKAEKNDMRSGMELGADDYLTKPCLPDELLKAINTRLDKQARIKEASQGQLDELRDSIARSLPHELRTPLNGIMGFAELMSYEAEDLKPEEIREMADQILVSSNRLYRLIQNFLLYADLELASKNSDRLQQWRSQATTSIRDAVEEVISLKADQCGRTADLKYQLEDSPVQIEASRLQKLVQEAIDNAFKFSPTGTPVQVTTTVQDNTVVLTLINSGRGMTPEEIEQVGAYMQFNRKLHEQQGSGLGLAIAKRMAQIHQGDLTIASIPDQETRITITLPTGG